MTMSRPKLEEIIRGIEEHYLREKVSKEDRDKIAGEITEWEAIAPFFGLTKVQVEDVEKSGKVKVQRMQMLETWSTNLGGNATYMEMIRIFWEQDRTDLAEMVSDILRDRQNAPHHDPPVQQPLSQQVPTNGVPYPAVSVGSVSGVSHSNTAATPPNYTTNVPPSQSGNTFTQLPQNSPDIHHHPDTSSNQPEQACVDSIDYSQPSPSLKPGKVPSAHPVNPAEGVFFTSDYSPNTDVKLFCSPSEKLRFSSIYWGLPTQGLDGEGTIAAILDTGICDHAALPLYVTKNGNTCPKILTDFSRNFTSNPPDNNIIDVDGHGSRSAGILAGFGYQGAFDVNNPTITGVFPGGIAPAAQLIICRIGVNASFSLQTIINALNWLIQIQQERRCRVHVVSMSFGIAGYNPDLEDRIRILNQNYGTICVAAGSNSGRTLPESRSICCPAKFGDVICVGAHDSYGNRAPFSPKGAEMEFLAPGKCIAAPALKNIHALSCGDGTSSATPAIAGLVAAPALKNIHALSCGDGTSSATPAIAGLVLQLIQMAVKAGPPCSDHISHVEIIRTLLIEMSTTKDRTSENGYGPLNPSKWLKKQFDLNFKELEWTIKDKIGG